MVLLLRDQADEIRIIGNLSSGFECALPVAILTPGQR